MENEYVGYSFNTPDGLIANGKSSPFKEYFDSIRGTKVTHTCIFEVITDGQKYNVKANFDSTYDGNCKTAAKTYTITYDANGVKDTVTFTYEKPLEVKIYDGNTLLRTMENNGFEYITASDAVIKSNVKAIFTTTGNNVVASKTDKVLTLNHQVNSHVTVTTTCGQTAGTSVSMVVN